MNDIPHRRIQTAWRIHPDDYHCGIFAGGIGDAFAQIVAGRRPDGAIYRQQVGDFIFLGNGGHGQQTREQQEMADICKHR